MSHFDRELRDCLGEILGAQPPPPEGDALLFFKQWLAERNLGLVPIDGAGTFAWPGRWLARVRGSDGTHAVVMFGSPSGPIFDPAGALSNDGTIEAGWLLAPLDLELSTDKPYGSDAGVGSVAGLLLAAEAEAPLVVVDEALAIAGRGLEGDRYAAARGTFSGPGRGYELTLIEAEVLDEIDLSWEQARRNIVTRGVALNALVGRRFFVGSVECVGRRLAEPCSHLERLARPELLRPLVHRGGLRADILVGGPIKTGDRVETGH
ncbi:MAG TPA: MOSC domain-containing protein [Gaiellaceae bacterium]|nr:MOSC domain-containing protein [Gaiellaceae bacterium]